MNRLFTFHFSLFTLIAALLITSCHKNDEELIPADYGTVSFELVRHNVYLVTKLSTAHTIKITVVDANCKKTVLPSLELTGTDDLIATKPYALPAGLYAIESYRCFDNHGDLIEDLDITLTRENTFTVTAGEATAFSLPVQVKNVLTTSNLYNSLYGLCLEVLGADKSKWPKSWDFDGEGIDGNWAGLEFEWDVNTYTPTELIGIVIDGNPEYIINSDTGEEILVSLPEFKGMKKLPACIANFTSLDGISIRNCDMEELCPELQFSPITSLTVYNTKLKSVPEELGRMKYLYDVWLEGNCLTEFPEAFTRCKDMQSFVIKDEAISSIPESVGDWGKSLVSFEVTGTNITTLPNVFDKLYNVSTLVLDNNRQLSTLPATIALEEIPYEGGGITKTGITGLSLDGCAFTEIPAAAKRNRMEYLSMCRNKLTAVSKEDFDAMPDLQTLKLDGNQFTTFPALTNPNLGYLSLKGCGLSRSQVDISGLPMLRSTYFYCE